MTELKNTELYKIPEADHYIVSLDTFMSGWGMAEGKKNFCIVPIPDMAKYEIDRIYDYICNREEQRQVIILERKDIFTYLEKLQSKHQTRFDIVEGWIKTALRCS